MLFSLRCHGNHVQDLAQYVNEVKRDNETLREIDQYQKSIENLVSRPLLVLVNAAPSLWLHSSLSSPAESGSQ